MPAAPAGCPQERLRVRWAQSAVAIGRRVLAARWRHGPTPGKPPARQRQMAAVRHLNRP
jgi:hypothetical protein